MPESEVFKVGDKVETTKEHDQFFGTHTKGIIDKIDDKYIDLYTQLGDYITMHIKWVRPYKGNFNWFYRRKLV